MGREADGSLSTLPHSPTPTPVPPAHDPQKEAWMKKNESSLWFFPDRTQVSALLVSDHTPLVPPGELARQASLGAEPALSLFISRSVSRWIYHWVIKAINKLLIVGWARSGTHAPCIVLSSSGPTQPLKQCFTSSQEAADPSQPPGLAHVLWPSHCLRVLRIQPFP